MEASLQSSESLDRASPELWPERRDYAACAELLSQGGTTGVSTVTSPETVTDQDFTPQDMKLFHEYAGLSPTQMIEVVKQLQNVAYLLGLEEAKEMRRGKYLNILYRRRPQ
ncbi:protein lin-52 homolog [Pollicipes pollicipes]|uniref:protein lin-52 homolog n=1 Tax=Pollicipes pollicipes TaxID=41117 RepID=UPI00188544C1|nr:protein lin-52 homolog [Pollicipes pollicipes]